MAYDGIAKVQHYVPKFLLRNFGVGKKDKLHVFDKQTGSMFATNFKNVAAESRFYDFEVEGHIFTVEPSLSKLEGIAKPMLKAILDTDSLSHLSVEDRGKLSIFFAVQFVRTKWFREQFRQLPKLLEQRLRIAEGTDLSSVEEFIRTPDDNELAKEATHFISKAPQDFAVHFANKLWLLVATDSNNPFLIGDNPIGLQNSIDMGPFGNIGLGVEGIEIYFPLSPRRGLAMLCQSHEKAFQDAANRQGKGGSAYQCLMAMESGSPLAYPPQCVLNFNSLQVKHAERFVFSSTGDFSLAKEMIAKHESYKTGPRAVVN